VIVLEINVVAALAMLGIAAYYDLKERSVSDLLWIGFGSIGVLMQVLEGLPTSYTIASILATAGIAVLALFLKLYGAADAIAIIVLAVILPIYNDLILPLAVLLGASFISLIFTCSFNALTNLRILIKDGKIFGEFNEPLQRRIIAFFLVHKKGKKERFAFAAEFNDNGYRKFRFFNRADSEFVTDGIYVTSAIPLTVFMLVALIAIIFLPELWPNLFTEVRGMENGESICLQAGDESVLHQVSLSGL